MPKAKDIKQAQQKTAQQSIVERPEKSLAEFLEKNENAHLHYNFIEEIYYRVSTGSMNLDIATGGGLMPGVHRFVGATEGGKSSEALEVMRNHLKEPNTRGFLVKAEGRLHREMQERCGIPFVFDPDKWEDGTCFVLETNIYELVGRTINMLFANNVHAQKRYCFIIDSVDALMSEKNLTKEAGDGRSPGGGTPMITAQLLQQCSISMSKYGHLAIFISQVRDQVSIDPYAKKVHKITSSAGGHALNHYANFVLEFQPRTFNSMILKDPKGKLDEEKNPALGHVVTVIVKKSTNESTHKSVKYPVRYGRRKQSSIWTEREIFEPLLTYQFLVRKGAWISFSEPLQKELDAAGIVVEPKYQGEDNFFSALEGNQKLSDFLKAKIADFISTISGLE